MSTDSQQAKLEEVVETLSSKNDRVDVAQVLETLSALRELRSKGLRRSEYNLLSPYSRRMQRCVSEGQGSEDPRLVRLRSRANQTD